MPVTTFYPDCSCCAGSGSGGPSPRVFIECLDLCNMIPESLFITISTVPNCPCISGQTFTLIYNNPAFGASFMGSWTAITPTCGNTQGVIIRLVPCAGTTTGCIPADCPSIPAPGLWVWNLFFYCGPVDGGNLAFTGNLVPPSNCNYDPFTLTFQDFGGAGDFFGDDSDCCASWVADPTAVAVVTE